MQQAFDPYFETGLAPQLGRKAASADAIRAAVLLPGQLRFQAARCMLFLAGVAMTTRPEMRAPALEGLTIAMADYDAVRDLLADWQDWPDLHPDLHPLFAAVDARGSGALTAIDALRADVQTGFDAMSAGQVPPDGFYDKAMETAYNTFQPAILSLTARMTDAGDAIRRAGEASAKEAQARALDARERIETIARTVRLISLNARVEAAHAGEAGRAFGVIAEEIKALSEQTEAVSAEMGESVDEILSALRIL